MPIVTGMELARAAISDVLCQSVPTRLLVINQGATDAIRDELERIAEVDDRVFCWSHQPPLPSLSTSWNRGLQFVWEAGGEEALVVNFDLRLHRLTVEHLRDVLHATDALLVSAVGVTEPQFKEVTGSEYFAASVEHDDIQKGGPDYSCFLISKTCHERFPFDAGFIPAFGEDLDHHRRLMLAGEGQRIFSTNLPYLHFASQTLKLLPPKEADALRHQIETVSRAHYRDAWGGGVNAETFMRKGDPTSAVTDGSATTPALFEKERARWTVSC